MLNVKDVHYIEWDIQLWIRPLFIYFLFQVRLKKFMLPHYHLVIEIPGHCGGIDKKKKLI